MYTYFVSLLFIYFLYTYTYTYILILKLPIIVYNYSNTTLHTLLYYHIASTNSSTM